MAYSIVTGPAVQQLQCLRQKLGRVEL